MAKVGTIEAVITAKVEPLRRALDSATKDFSRLQSGMRSTQAETVRLASALNKDLAQSAAKAERGLASLVSATASFTRAVTAAGAAWASSKLVQGLNDFAQMAHEAGAGAVVFGRMLERAGESSHRVRSEVQALADELRVAPEVIRSNAAELLRAGYTWDQIATIYRGAGASALLAGKSTAQGVEIATAALVTGLSTYLNQIGITQNLSTAFTEYARSIGKTTDQLTDQERAAAATLMIHRATAQEIEDMPVLLEGYGGAVSDLSRAWYDFRVVLGTLALPAVTAAIRAFTDLLGPLTQVIQWVRDLTSGVREAADAANEAALDSLSQAESYKKQAEEIRGLLARYDQLVAKTDLSATEQAELEQIMARIRDHQPALVSGFDALNNALEQNADSVRRYAAALEEMSEAELKVAEQRVLAEMPRVQARRDQLASELEAARAEYQRLLEIAAAGDEIVQRAVQMLRNWQAAIGREAPDVVERLLRELEDYLARHFPAEFMPGLSNAPAFVMGLEASISGRMERALEGLEPAAERVKDLEAEIRSLDRTLQDLESTLEAIRRVGRGEPAFPEDVAAPTTASSGRGVGGLAALALERSWAAYGARLQAAADYYAQLPELQRKANEQRRQLEEKLRDEIDQLAMSSTQYFLHQLDRQVEALRAAGADEALIWEWRMAQYNDFRRKQLQETIAALKQETDAALRLEEQAARERVQLQEQIADDINRATMTATDYFAWQLARQVEAFRAAGIEEADIARWVAVQWEEYWEKAEEEAVRATERAAEERRRIEERLAADRERYVARITAEINRIRMSETDYFAWQLRQQVDAFRAAGVEETLIAQWTAAQWDAYFEQKASAVERVRDELDELIRALRTAGEIELSRALTDLQVQAETGDLFASRIAQAQLDEATRIFWSALTETGDVALAAARAMETLRGTTEAVDVSMRRAEWALEQVAGTVPGLQKALEAYRRATTAAAAGGLGLSAAGGAAAAAFTLLLNTSHALNAALGAVAEGLAALLAPINALLSMLGPKVSGAAVGAKVGSYFGPIGTAVGAVVGAVAGWLGGAAQEQVSAAEILRDASEALRQAAEEWREFLRSAPLHELFAELDLIEQRREAFQRARDALPPFFRQFLPEPTGVEVPPELLRERDRIQKEIRDIEKWGVWPWERSRYESLKDALREIDKQIREFQESAAGELEERIREALGIGWRELAGGVRSAFQAENLEDFTSSIERELKTRVRDAMITAFLESATMAPLFQELSDRIFAAVRDGVVTAGELDAIEDVISQITDKSAAFFDVLDQLGLGMKDLADTTREVNESLRNVPSGFKIALRRFEIQDPVPMARGGIVTRPTIALIGEAGPEAVVPLDGSAPALGTTIIVQVQGPVYGMDDFDRRVQEAVNKAARRANLASTGLARR